MGASELFWAVFELKAPGVPPGLHLGILLVELGVGIAVAGSMLVIFYAFAGRRMD